MADTVTLTLAEATELAVRALVAADTSEANARSTAAALIAAEADGQAGHGLSRVPSYAAQARSGKVDGHAVPRVERTAAASLRADAARGFAYPALDAAIARLIPLVREAGTAAAAIGASHHMGQAGLQVERLADEGLVALAMSNTPHAMAFHGGSRSRMGTNPLAFAAPLPGREPLVIDLSLSVAARGKIVAAEKAGRAIPEGWAVDAAGLPTTDPAAALKGSLLPIGGAKGSALALMVEVLCAALAGSNFGWEASSFFEAEGPSPQVGQVFIALDPAAFAGPGFLDRMGELAAAVAEDGARLPGDRRLTSRRGAAENGLAIAAGLHRELEALA
jgi:(2R)-3-sulfolactate dehydrogenase (NADP+)